MCITSKLKNSNRVLKEIKENLKNDHIQFSLTLRLNIFDLYIMKSGPESQKSFKQTAKVILKLIWKFKGPRRAKTIKQEEQD